MRLFFNSNDLRLRVPQFNFRWDLGLNKGIQVKEILGYL